MKKPFYRFRFFAQFGEKIYAVPYEINATLYIDTRDLKHPILIGIER